MLLNACLVAFIFISVYYFCYDAKKPILFYIVYFTNLNIGDSKLLMKSQNRHLIKKKNKTKFSNFEKIALDHLTNNH